jgi:hypothetical protein
MASSADQTRKRAPADAQRCRAHSVENEKYAKFLIALFSPVVKSHSKIIEKQKFIDEVSQFHHGATLCENMAAKMKQNRIFLTILPGYL